MESTASRRSPLQFPYVIANTVKVYSTIAR